MPPHRELGSARPVSPTITYAGIGDEAGASLGSQLDALARLGWSSVELRTVEGLPLARLDDRTFTRLAHTLAARGMAVACVASQIGNWSRPIDGDFAQDLEELAILARRCAVLGTPYLRIMSYPNAGLQARDWQRRVVNRIRELVGRAEGAGLVLLHENCTGWSGRKAERMLQLLDAVASPALRLLFDTGNGVAHGYDGRELLSAIVDHVAHVHVKDARRSTREVLYTLPGAGRAGVGECLRTLLTSGYTGVWSIEPHLALRPHESRQHPASGLDGLERGDDVGGRRREGFVACGLALERLVCEQVLPAFPCWRPASGGRIERRGP